MLSSITPDASASAAQSKSAMTPDKSYRLVAQGGGVDLSAHAGHKVAVTGVVREGSSAATGTETDKTRTFEVRSLKMVASTCS
jgi:hypothetical protein